MAILPVGSPVVIVYGMNELAPLSSVAPEDCEEELQAFLVPPTIRYIETVLYRAEECVCRPLVGGQEIQVSEARRWPISLLLCSQQADKEVSLPPSHAEPLGVGP